MGTLSGPATACVLRRQRDVFGDARFERLGSISVAHLYNLRTSAGYRAQRVVLTKTRPDQGRARSACARRRPPRAARASCASTACTRATGTASRACTTSTRWTASPSGRWWPRVQTICEAHLLPVIEQMLEQFPFEILGFHADNGSEYVNHRVAAHAGQAAHRVHAQSPAAQQRQRPGRDQERRRGAQVSSATSTSRSVTPRASTPSAREYLNPFLNFHRPCLFATDKPDPKKPGRIKRVYRAKDAMTPLDKLASLPEAHTFMREGITLEHLQAAGHGADRRAGWRGTQARRGRRCSNGYRHERAELSCAGAKGGGRLWTCGRCAHAHRHGPWTTPCVAHRPHLRPHAHSLRPRSYELQGAGPQYTVSVYNGSTLHASPRSGLSRLIPRLEKTGASNDDTLRRNNKRQVSGKQSGPLAGGSGSWAGPH